MRLGPTRIRNDYKQDQLEIRPTTNRTKQDQDQLRIEPIRTRTKYDQDELGPTRTDCDLLEPITSKTNQQQDQIRPGPIKIRIKDDQEQLGLGPTTSKTKRPTKTRTNYDQPGPTRTYQDQLRLGQTKAIRRAVQRRRANGATSKRCNNPCSCSQLTRLWMVQSTYL